MTPDLPPYGRFILLIDGTNFYHTQRDLKLHVDYKKLLEYFRLCGRLIRAHYFTALLDAPLTQEWLIRLIDWLMFNGYQVHTKRAKVFERRVNTGSEIGYVREIKGNVEIEIVVEALNAVAYCDTIILFSGSGELVSLVKAVQRHGCRVVVVSSERTADSTVSNELRRIADDFIDLETLRPHITMPLQKVPLG